MVIARINLRADHFQRQFERLHSVNTNCRSGQFFFGPIDFDAARPVYLLRLWSENTDWNFDVSLRPTQRENACRDDHVDSLNLSAEATDAPASMPRSAPLLASDTHNVDVRA